MRCIGVQSVPLGSFADCSRIEPGRLNEDIRRLFSDHRVEAAHYSGQSYGLACVRDDQIFGREFAVNAVKGFQSFAIARPADDDFPTFEQVKIKGMRRMPHLPERVIGSIGGVVDGALINECETCCDFLRRWLDLYTADNLRRVARAAFSILDLDGERLCRGRSSE